MGGSITNLDWRLSGALDTQPAFRTIFLAGTPVISESDARAGLGAGLGAFILWGFLPLLFHLLSAAGSVTVVADRTIWSLLLVGGIVVFGRRLGEVRAALS